ncbi:MAG: helix-turn-helix domain-containing protein [Atopobium minutum]|uniref:helix-turn-helix domain-containing protein n=1 Tax=Atopobium minutum TaxID=1381 RepID=UPI00290DE49B|nr:helix-turn-helix domain-containing protein [Atopobium minutum]MDU5356762.1 helix-turn-helix domain-containing protein [Atopobium minutum]
MDIGRAIREIATQRNMTQADIARHTGLPDAHVTQLWNSKIYDPRASILCRIAISLQVSPSEIFNLAMQYPHQKDKD